MLLVHQTGNVKVGELIRYTLTYDPAADRVVPSPTHLHVRVKNTSAIPLRAAYLNGPYALHVAAYPSVFNPYIKLENPRRDGMPQFEPNLKAGSTFSAKLTIPDDHRIKSQAEANKVADTKEKRTVSWIIEVTSQILFSASSSVKFELSIGRDEKSLSINYHAVGNKQDGNVQDLQEGRNRRSSIGGHHTKGVYSKAISLVIEDTEVLWDRPALPVWDDATHHARKSTENKSKSALKEHTRSRKKKKQKIHLVVVTHGLHSNLGADMLYVKESIDATARASRESRRKARAARQNSSKSNSSNNKDDSEIPSIAPLSGGQDELNDDSDDSDEEQIVVRGFPGNAARTENGIKYLGKRLARFVLDFTYPDQPVKFIKKKSITEKITRSMSFRPGKEDDEHDEGVPSHDGSRIRTRFGHPDQLAYTFTSISFIGHSLGGLVQLYAIAYIQKHAPGFFEQLQPINFIAMATPFLGLSNENPLYVKFALEFGFVGRTGRDLGLTWRTPAIARTGWSALVGGLGGDKEQHEDPRSKPLLRVLPTGPAHIVLRRFRNRTVYSNVVNDGIVPLRTGCLLFLDWRGLGKVEKARRENGFVGTFVGWGWAEMTGQNSLQPPHAGEDDAATSDSDDNEDGGTQSRVPQPPENAVNEDDDGHSVKSAKDGDDSSKHHSSPSGGGAIDAILNFLRPTAKTTKKDIKMFHRSQTLPPETESDNESSNTATNGSEQRSPSTERGRSKRPIATRGDSMENNHESPAPPKTTIFESAADLLSPPTPPTAWIIDPESRSRTIFHDRVYHPEDIPPPPKSPARAMSSSSTRTISTTDETNASGDTGMRVEEKIARAYHRDLSWRKVLVRLEPDAHNNMIVRRAFANAYGWPVVKHLCDTHFGDTFSARTRDENEPSHDRAHGVNTAVPKGGEQVEGQTSKNAPDNIPDDMHRKATGELKPLEEGGVEAVQERIRRDDSVEVDDSYLDDTSDEEPDQRSPFQRLWSPMPKSPSSSPERRSSSPRHKTMPVKAGPAPPVVTSKLTDEPGTIDDSAVMPKITLSSSAGTSELGLRKSVPQIIAGTQTDPSEARVSENVAKRASTTDAKQFQP